jgi:NifB/MoaA-like Fe-S oxidoreductase
LYLGDEFYLMTGQPIPPTSRYDGFPQVEDGIGITRLFIDDAERVIKRGKPERAAGCSGAIACGILIAPTMQRLVDEINQRVGARLRVVPIVNSFLGPEISVSGLLTGGLIRDTFATESANDPVFISETMVSKRTQTFLDDLSIEDLTSALGRPVVAADYLSQVLQYLVRTPSRAVA